MTETPSPAPGATTPPSTTPPETTTPPQIAIKTDPPSEGPKPSLADGGEEPPKVEGAPEKYEDWKLPEGFSAKPEALKEAGELFKGLNLSQESGQKLVDFYSKQLQEASKAPLAEYEAVQAKEVDRVMKDPDLGPKLDQVKSNISKALDLLGPELKNDFKHAMNLTGAGNFHAFVKGLNILATKLTEGTPVSAGGPTKITPPGKPSQPTAAQAMYPNLTSTLGSR